jgi:hypothetical protein
MVVRLSAVTGDEEYACKAENLAFVIYQIPESFSTYTHIKVL